MSDWIISGWISQAEYLRLDHSTRAREFAREDVPYQSVDDSSPAVRGLHPRKHRPELSIRFTLDFRHVFKSNFQRRADPSLDLAANVALVFHPVSCTAHSPNRDLSQLLLHDLDFLHVHGIFENVVKAHDARPLRSNDVIVFAAVNAQHCFRLASTRAGFSGLLPDSGISNFVTNERKCVT